MQNVHFRFPSVAQKRRLLKFPNNWMVDLVEKTRAVLFGESITPAPSAVIVSGLNLSKSRHALRVSARTMYLLTE